MRAWAKKTFTYNGEELEQGQVFELLGARNDPKLIGLRYCEQITKRTDVMDCTCGKSFVGEQALRAHQRGVKHPKEVIVLSSA